MEVKLVSKTQGVGEFAGRSMDEIIVGAARVSTTKANNELFVNPAGLIRHCIQQGHWSIFEMCDFGVEIITSMSIGEQILRHKSATFQKYSGRYSELHKLEPIELRKQAVSNRQSSTDIIDDEKLKKSLDTANKVALDTYQELLDAGVAREIARFILPAGIQTRMYMKSNIRSWITFLNVRLENHAQKEIRLIAQAIKDIFIKECPIIAEALYNFEGAEKAYILDKVILAKYE